MEEQPKTIDKKEEVPHMKKSAFALSILNDELRRLIQTRVSVNFLKKLQLIKNSADWKKINEAFMQKKQELEDCQVSIRAVKETYDDCLKEEAEGRWL